MGEMTVTHRVVEEVMGLLPKATWADAVDWCDAHLLAWRLNQQSSVEYIETCYEDEDDE